MKNEFSIQVLLSVLAILVILFFSFQYRQQISSFNKQLEPTTSTSIKEKATQGMKLSMEEIQKHNTPSDCWLVIENNVYDVTQYLSLHPGGANRITPYCGQDATTAFLTQGGRGSHSMEAVQQLGLLLLGPINSTVSPSRIHQQGNTINNSVNTGKLNTGGEKDDD